MSRLGVVVGYRAEARCLRDPRVHVLCSGIDPERARAAAQRLVDDGAAGLASFGLAGALAADLAPGELLLPDSVVLPDGATLPTDTVWRGRLAATFRRAGLRARSAPIAGSQGIVATPAAKRALFARTGAAAVDMESHAVAEIAARAGLPFIVLRAVADGADQAVPGVARGAVDARGNVRTRPVLVGLLGRPWEIGSLIALGRSSGRGLASLRRVAVLAPALGFA